MDPAPHPIHGIGFPSRIGASAVFFSNRNPQTAEPNSLDAHAILLEGFAHNVSSYTVEGMAATAALLLIQAADSSPRLAATAHRPHIVTDCQSLVHRIQHLAGGSVEAQRLHYVNPYYSQIPMRRNGSEHGLYIRFLLDHHMDYFLRWQKAHAERYSSKPMHQWSISQFGNFIADQIASGRETTARSHLRSLVIHRMAPSQLLASTNRFKIISSDGSPFLGSPGDIVKAACKQSLKAYFLQRAHKRVHGYREFVDLQWPLAGRILTKIPQEYHRFAMSIIYDKLPHGAFLAKIASRGASHDPVDCPLCQPATQDSQDHMFQSCHHPSLQTIRAEMSRALYHLIDPSSPDQYILRSHIDALLVPTPDHLDARALIGLLPTQYYSTLLSSPLVSTDLQKFLCNITTTALPFLKLIWTTYCDLTHTDKQTNEYLLTGLTAKQNLCDYY